MLVCSFAIAFGLDLTPYLINPSTLPTRWTRISTIALHRHLHLQARPCGGPYTGNTYIYNISRYTYILVYPILPRAQSEYVNGVLPEKARLAGTPHRNLTIPSSVSDP